MSLETDENSYNDAETITKGALLKRKDFMGVDQQADSHPHR
jgi:hypothetical protein